MHRASDYGVLVKSAVSHPTPGLTATAIMAYGRGFPHFDYIAVMAHHGTDMPSRPGVSMS